MSGIMRGMTEGNPTNPELTAEQEQLADFLLDQCGLTEVADEQLEMMGASGSVRYGLGRCASHLLELSPQDIKAMVELKLTQQQEG